MPAMTAEAVLEWLRKKGTRRNVDGLARYGITARRAYGVPVGTLLGLAKRLGKDHALAAALWKSGCYEARLLASMVDDPAQVTPRQMDAWTADFDNWGVCDTVCWHLFEKTPFAWKKARQWARSPREFVKRTGFALMACLAGHDQAASEAQFLALLPLIEKGARDERNFVKKAVSWALRRIGWRSASLNAAALALARRLAASPDATSRWVGKDAVRDLASPRLQARLARRAG